MGNVLLNRPHRRNAVTVDLASELANAVERFGHDETVEVITLRGAGASFCAGGDVHELAQLHAQGREAMRRLFYEFKRAIRTITEVRVPVVCVVQGSAAAGGFELMTACDVAVVSSDAQIADIHSRFGQVPGGGSTQHLPRIIGRPRAMGLILTGDTITGAQAAQWGLAYCAAEPGDLERTVDDIISRLLTNPSAAMARSKHLVNHALGNPLAQGLETETEQVIDHLEAEGPRAFAAFTQRKDIT